MIITLIIIIVFAKGHNFYSNLLKKYEFLKKEEMLFFFTMVGLLQTN